MFFHSYVFLYYRDEGDDLEQSEDSGQHKETVKRVTFALPDDEEMEDTDVFSIQKDSDEVKSSFEKRQEKVLNRYLKNFLSRGMQKSKIAQWRNNAENSQWASLS